MPIKPRDSKHSWNRILRMYLRPRRSRRGFDGLSEPVEPDYPKDMSGGAAAAIEIDN